MCQAAERLAKQHDCVAVFLSSCSADCPPEKNNIAFRPLRTGVAASSALLGIGAIALRFPTETEGRGLTALESFDVSHTSFSIFAVERRQKTHDIFCPSFMRKVICLWITRSS